jgi:hypothetical protein
MKTLISFFCAFLFLGCTQTLVKFKAKLSRSQYRIGYYSNGQKIVAYVPTLHINTPEYYAKIKGDVDSLRNAGYVIFYEGIKTDLDIPEQEKEILQKKFRRIMGFHLTEYFDSTNADLKKFRVKGLIEQTNANTGVLENLDYKADYDLKTLIEKFEKSKGIIRLNECDLATKLGEKYKCAKVVKEQRNYLAITLRDSFLAEQIITSNSKKIAVIFGENHEYGLGVALQKADTTFEYIPSWKAVTMTF